MTSKATSETVLQAQKSDNIDPKLKKGINLTFFYFKLN